MIYQFDKFVIDTCNFQLRKDDVPIDLEPKVYDLLVYLIANREKLVTRDELFDNLWAGHVVSDNSLSNQIKAARRAIDDDGKRQSRIKTIRCRGYQFIADISEQQPPDYSTGPGHLQIAREVKADSRPSVAVLPFTNLNNDPNYDYICDGITEDILIGLCRFRTLLVIARSSTFLYKGVTVDAIEAARKLDAEFLLEGSIRIAGERVRITTELVDGATGKDVWADTYDRVLDDVFSVQDDVTQRIVSTLASRLEKVGRAAAIKKNRDTLTVHDLLLRARHYYPDWDGTQDGVLRARKLYERALDLDPDCAAAYSGLACTDNIESSSDWSPDREAAAMRSFEHARRALMLDGRDSNAHMILACAYRDIWTDLEMAEKHIDKAIDSNPNDYWNYCCKSNLLNIGGRFGESILCAHEAIRRNPLLPDACLRNIGLAEYFLHQYQQAVATFGESLNPRPHVKAYMAACYAQLESPDKASRAAQAFFELNREQPMIDKPDDPESWFYYWKRVTHFKDQAMMNHLLDGLRKAGIVH